MWIVAAAQLTQHGVDRRRAYRRDVLSLGSGVFMLRQAAQQHDEDALYRMKALALARDVPQGRLSHSTAARVRGYPLPRRIFSDSTIHFSFTPDLGARRYRTGITAHYDGRRSATMLIHGIRYSRPARIWVEMAAVGADSPKETKFRLALIEAGLPEPQLQVPLNPSDPDSRRADAGYPQHRVAIQYDGAGHFNPQQARKDQRRDNAFVAEGWLVLRFNVEDDREGFATAIRQVAAALAAT